jgi:hypothetical protein
LKLHFDLFSAPYDCDDLNSRTERAEIGKEREALAVKLKELERERDEMKGDLQQLMAEQDSEEQRMAAIHNKQMVDLKEQLIQTKELLATSKAAVDDAITDATTKRDQYDELKRSYEAETAALRESLQAVTDAHDKDHADRQQRRKTRHERTRSVMAVTKAAGGVAGESSSSDDDEPINQQQQQQVNEKKATSDATVAAGTGWGDAADDSWLSGATTDDAADTKPSDTNIPTSTSSERNQSRAERRRMRHERRATLEAQLATETRERQRLASLLAENEEASRVAAAHHESHKLEVLDLKAQV